MSNDFFDEYGLKVCNKCYDYKGKDFFHRDTAKKDGLRNTCKECCSKISKEIAEARTVEDRKILADRSRKFRKNNPLKTKRYEKDRWCNNKDVRRASNKVWIENNKEYIKTKNKQWRDTNKAYIFESNATRRAYKKQAFPKWLTGLQLSQIKSIYSKCKDYRDMGFDMHVDHIIPLKGKIVSGLHVPENLQIVTRQYNLEKGNRYGE